MSACYVLVSTYAEGLATSGEVDWDDVNGAGDFACDALGEARCAEIAAQAVEDNKEADMTTFKTTLFKAISNADTIHIDDYEVENFTWLGNPPRVVAQTTEEEEIAMEDCEIEVDEFGQATVKCLDGEDHHFDFSVTKSLRAEDITR